MAVPMSLKLAISPMTENSFIVDSAAANLPTLVPAPALAALTSALATALACSAAVDVATCAADTCAA